MSLKLKFPNPMLLQVSALKVFPESHPLERMFDLLVVLECTKMMEEKPTALKVRDVQCNEMWGYVGMKEKQKGRERRGADTLGDAYTFVALERNSKLILASDLGRRTSRDRLTFMLKLHRATDGKFQLTTDGWTAYPDAVERVFGNATDFAQMVKGLCACYRWRAALFPSRGC